MLISAGLLYLLGSIVDLVTLWGLQRQPGPNWMFVASGNTLDGIPRFGLAFGLISAGLWARGTRGQGWYRTVGAGFLIVALGTAALVAVLMANYQTLARASVPPELAGMFRASALKGAVIGGAAVVLYLVAGLASVRSARA